MRAGESFGDGAAIVICSQGAQCVCAGTALLLRFEVEVRSSCAVGAALLL